MLAIPPSQDPAFRRRTGHVNSRAGMTLVEVMVAILVLTVAVFILSSTVTASVSHTIVKGQRTLAVEAAMGTIERVRALPQEDVFALYNDVAFDDPYGAGSGPGPTFDVEGLNPVLDAAGNPLPIGRVLLPGKEEVLDESIVEPEFGLPRDLDGNLVVESGNCADRYIILPLTVRIEWLSRLGPRSLEMSTMISDLEKWKE